MIELEVNGIRYTRFNEINVNMAIDAIARSFSFEASTSAGIALPFTGGEACRVIVDGITVVTGTIERVRVSSSGESHDIVVSGRSITGDLVDSSLEAIEINLPISLTSVIERVLSVLGISILVIDNSGGIDDFNEAEDKIGPKVGENAFSFIERLARKRQVILNCDGESNIVLTRANPELLDVTLQNIINSNTNNIITSTVVYDRTDRFRSYTVKSQLNTSLFSAQANFGEAVDQGGNSIDEEVREGRQLVMKAEKSSSNTQSRLRALWEANIRRTRSVTYTAVVRGFQSGAEDIWTLNTLVLVNDVFANIDARMLVNSITFSSSLSGNGSTTTLGLVEKNSYLVEISEPAPADKVGPSLFLNAS